ncbi:MAG: hypothetical protein ACAI25_14355 [Planctomycetota bacterium]
MKRSVTILYDRIEDDAFDAAKTAGEDTTELVPIHVMLGEALASRGYKIAKIAATRDVKKLFHDLSSDKSDVVFNVCDGLEGDMKAAANVVSLLELLGRPFTGSGSCAMRLAGDKTIAKQIFLANGIMTPRYAVIARGELRWADHDIDFPLFVKPIDEDASVGITERSVVRDVRELLDRVSAVHEEFRTSALVEEFIAGREIYASIIGNERAEVLPFLEWPMKDADSIGSYDAKWKEDHEHYQKRADVFPTDLPPALVERIRREAIIAYRALKLTDYARVDIRLSTDGTPYFLEANPNPFFDPTAEIAMAANAVGLDYGALAERVIEYALERRPAVEVRSPLVGVAAGALSAPGRAEPTPRSRRQKQRRRRLGAKTEPVKNGNGRGGKKNKAA